MQVVCIHINQAANQHKAQKPLPIKRKAGVSPPGRMLSNRLQEIVGIVITIRISPLKCLEFHSELCI